MSGTDGSARRAAAIAVVAAVACLLSGCGGLGPSHEATLPSTSDAKALKICEHSVPDARVDNGFTAEGAQDSTVAGVRKLLAAPFTRRTTIELRSLSGSTYLALCYEKRGDVRVLIAMPRTNGDIYFVSSWN